MAISDLAKKVNSGEFQVYITSIAAGNFYAEMQNARLLISHSEFREPTTGGTVVYYSGQPDNSLSGTLLYTVEQWDRGTTGWAALLSRTNGEVKLDVFKVQLKGEDGTTDTFTFNNAKISVVDFSKPVEGGIKIDISIVLPTDPS